MKQLVVPLNGNLESLIGDAQNEPGPGVSHPDVARELVNEHNSYYQAVPFRRPKAEMGLSSSSSAPSLTGHS